MGLVQAPSSLLISIILEDLLFFNQVNSPFILMGLGGLKKWFHLEKLTRRREWKPRLRGW